MASEPATEVFDYLMASRGWVVFPKVFAEPQLSAMREDLDRLYEVCREVQTRNGVAAGMVGTAHHLVGYGTSLDAMVDDFPLLPWVERFFGGKSILLNFGASLNPPGSRAYVARPHRDVRRFSRDARLSLNMLVMLDAFTPQSGGTRLLAGSHHVEALPPLALFDSHAEQIAGQPGDVILFDSQVVHAAAPNTGSERRRALTLCLGRPWMKPQVDFARFIPPERQQDLSPTARQLYGFDARMAESLDDFYQPPDRWAFKADQQ